MRNIVVRKFLCVASALACVTMSYAQEQQEALGFLRKQRDPAALSGGAAAGWSNPSLASFGEKKIEAAFSYASWAAAPSSDLSMAASYRLNPRFVIVADLSVDMGEKYDIYNKLGKVTDTFTPKDLIGGVGASFLLKDNLSLGATVKYASSRLAPEASYGSVAADVFVTGRVGGLTGTAGVSSLGPGVESSDGTKYPLPTSGSFGFGYTGDFGEKLRTEVWLTSDVYFSGAVAAGFGASICYDSLLTLRAGYNNGGESIIPSYTTVGGGVHFSSFSIDAVYYLTASDSPLANTLAVALRMSL